MGIITILKHIIKAPDYALWIMKIVLYYPLNNQIVRFFQKRILSEQYDCHSKRLMIHLTPGFNAINGGILSIASIYAETKKLSEVHNCEVILCSLPDEPLLLRYTKFENTNIIFEFSKVIRYFKELDYLMIHVPEYGISQLLKALKNNCNNINEFRINVLIQNVELFPQLSLLNELKKIARVTCTTAHSRYTTEDFKNRLGTPLHKLSTYVSPEQYHRKTYAEKEDLFVVSPDTHPQKKDILRLIKKTFPHIKIKIINNISYMQFKDIVSRAKWALTFGEGLDGYFVESVFSGGIAFAVYNSKFFTEEFKKLGTIYLNYDILIAKITGDINNLDREYNYQKYQDSQYVLCSKYYKHEEYIQNIIAFYKGEYTFS